MAHIPVARSYYSGDSDIGRMMTSKEPKTLNILDLEDEVKWRDMLGGTLYLRQSSGANPGSTSSTVHSAQEGASFGC